MFTLITNNTDLSHNVPSSCLIDGSPLEVLIHVRSLVHSGSRLLTHPLCGNLRPYHQPFRSVIVDELHGSADLESLTMIEEAVRVYQSCKVIHPASLSEAMRKDYAYIDAELMRESLEQLGLIKTLGLQAAPLLLMKEGL